TDAASSAVTRFLALWRTAWLASVDVSGGVATDVRMRDVHCHYDGSYGNSGVRGNAHPPSLIHRSGRRSMCPDWVPSDERVPYDERLNHDASLTPAWREQVRAARALLLDSLAILDARHPSDAWITGERVRFLVDQGNVAGATTVAHTCTANRVWCAQLVGFVFDAAGDFTRADSAFDAASVAMDAKTRCEWTSVEHLLDDDGRSAYDRLSCDERARANETMWWLSTPLFSDSVSDRRSQQFARKVLIQLHSATPWDERFDWRGGYGGRAVSEMLLRYGWPAYSVFGGMFEEQSHAGWMHLYDSTRTATVEYSQDRLHLIPDWRAVANPFAAQSDAWQINMPPLTDDDEPAAQWWPAEHYSRADGPIVQLAEQTVVLRRDDDVLIATASEINRPNGILLQASNDGPILIRTTGPRDVQQIPHETLRNSAAMVLVAHIPAEPAIVGTELRAPSSGEPAARTRVGVMPPLPLSALKPGELAISDPVLLAADDARPAGPDQALSKMLGSRHVRSDKLGLYWETYGVAPGDSVDVAVVITRHESLSKMRRMGMFLRVAHDINGSVAVQWTEPHAGHDSWTIPGAAPIQARSIQMDLSRLEPGHYNVQVRVRREGTGLPVIAGRDFVLERRK
ncbi:MAG TPA: hypothetical protein VGM50_10750, partial [Gemmatimonadaceae bacterium]